jgi:hypothetical protein
MELNYFYIGFGVIVLLNVIVSILLIKRDDLEVFQKVVQVILVWLIPFFAAVGLWLFYRSQDKPKSPPKSFGGGTSSGTNTYNGSGL